MALPVIGGFVPIDLPCLRGLGYDRDNLDTDCFCGRPLKRTAILCPIEPYVCLGSGRVIG